MNERLSAFNGYLPPYGVRRKALLQDGGGVCDRLRGETQPLFPETLALNIRIGDCHKISDWVLPLSYTHARVHTRLSCGIIQSFLHLIIVLIFLKLLVSPLYICKGTIPVDYCSKHF